MKAPGQSRGRLRGLGPTPGSKKDLKQTEWDIGILVQLSGLGTQMATSGEFGSVEPTQILVRACVCVCLLFIILGILKSLIRLENSLNGFCSMTLQPTLPCERKFM